MIVFVVLAIIGILFFLFGKPLMAALCFLIAVPFSFKALFKSFEDEAGKQNISEHYHSLPKPTITYQSAEARRRQEERDRKYNAWREEFDRLQREKREREEKRLAEAKAKLLKAEKDFEVVDKMTGFEFERYCASLLEKSGFENVRVTQASGDHGVDVIAEKEGIKYAVQCKRYAKPVGFKAVTEIYTGKSLYEADKAIIMTTSRFTDQAISDAHKLGVELWNRKKIMEIANGNGEETPLGIVAN